MEWRRIHPLRALAYGLALAALAGAAVWALGGVGGGAEPADAQSGGAQPDGAERARAVGPAGPPPGSSSPDEAGSAPLPPPESAGGAVPGELIVRFEPGAGGDARAAARRAVGAEVERGLPLPGAELVELPPGLARPEAIERLEKRAAVRYAEPNFYRSLALTPDDPGFDLQWGLHNTGQPVAGQQQGGTPDADIDAPEAWEVTVGEPGVTVAVIDTGVDQGHPDLAPRAWKNPGETGDGREANGKDDDGNGYVDDWRGWDWVEDDNLAQDANGHGTHVAGTAAAAGDDSTGVVGVAWESRVMPLRVLGADGSGTVADLIDAYEYAGAEGAEIVNASLGGQDASKAERDAIAAAPDTLFVVAAGNGGEDRVGDDNDVTPEYPCAYELSNVLCVAASNQDDGLASFSNYGAQSVDLAAPGTNIVSDWPRAGCGGDPCYAYLSGTSMATPHVAGAAALVLAGNPGASVEDVRRALLAGVDEKPAFNSKTASGGRLNAAGALKQTGALIEVDQTPPAVFGPGERFVAGQRLTLREAPLQVRWAGRDDVTKDADLVYDLEMAAGTGGDWSRLRTSTRARQATLQLVPGVRRQFRVRSRDEAGNQSDWSRGPSFVLRAFQDGARKVRYRGKWRERTARSAYGGTVRSSKQRGATAAMRFRGRDAAVVMPRGSAFGVARICLDPGTCQRVNLGSGKGPRFMVFARDGLDPSALQEVTVEVLRGRVDLDAILVAR